MLRAAIVFFVLGLVGMALGASGFAGLSIDIGRTLLYVFLILAVVSFLASLIGGRRIHGFIWMLLCLSAGTSAGVLFTPSKALCDDTTSTSNQAALTSEYRSPDRFFRRVIFEGSYANAGYEGSDTGRYSKPNGYTAGALLDLLGTGNLVLETGALYRQFGTNYNNGLGNNTFTADYISVPVDAKYYFSGQEVTSFYVKGGLMGSTLISNNTMYATPTSQIGARAWETAFLGGVGVKIYLSPETDFLVEVNYSRSIDSIMTGATIYRSDISGGLGLAVNL